MPVLPLAAVGPLLLFAAAGRLAAACGAVGSSRGGDTGRCSAANVLLQLDAQHSVGMGHSVTICYVHNACKLAHGRICGALEQHGQ